VCRGPRARGLRPRQPDREDGRGAREVADRLEKVVADDLWPLSKYEEMLFIK
jgi:glutamine synthetase type III